MTSNDKWVLPEDPQRKGHLDANESRWRSAMTLSASLFCDLHLIIVVQK